MILFGDTIVLTSEHYFYVKEESGEKPYTVRIMKPDTYEKMNLFGTKRVKIVGIDEDEGTYFERRITSIDRFGGLLGHVLVGIAWDPREGEK